MATEHYNLIVLGANIGEQICATLLARQGYRVLSLPSAIQPAAQSLPCCPALNKLLKTLEGEHLLIDSGESLQLVTNDIRLQVGGLLPLENELLREFPKHHPSILALLARLDEWGRKLSLLLASPAPDASLIAFRLLTLYRRQLAQKLPARRLQQPILKLTTTLGSHKPQEALNQLLSGLCLVAPKRLSIAEAALKWHITTRPQTISLSDLSQLLTERYAAAGGQHIPLDELSGMERAGKRQTGASLKNGKVLSADQFLIGSLPEHVEPYPALTSTLAKVPGKPQTWTLSNLPRQRLSILSRQVILAGEQTLRLTWDQNKLTPGQALLEAAQPPDQTQLTTDMVREQLSSVLPFIDYELTESARPQNEKVMPKCFWPRGSLPNPVASNAIFCHGSQLLPSIGLNADIMLGQAVAGCLQKRMG
ncbi:hypothetical protein A7E78_01645 [Syntrophotalea acetylenivorans]|uniref:FAD dependent oxidoreductase domain-containing protein n=1 Tax=Syntrophotalea acetylenivorans TaxID=1842532 RepID=A0A1L3GL56_9BACT|nr:hypothetical protein [Syntrophotalea acetylenivorans]APG26677.1 hypothetical protein A7E78_01645 [Syntrophotalea acetylenivorans]